MSFRKKFLIHFALVIAGLIAGWLFTLVSYSTETTRTEGFPVPWAGFRKMNDHWVDFVSPISLFIYLFDVLFGILCIYLFAAGLWLIVKIWIRIRRK